MIDWQANATTLATLLPLVQAAGPLAPDVVSAHAEGWPAFRNRPFDVTPAPLLITQQAAGEHAARISRYVRILEHLLTLYRREPAVRAFIGLEPEEERLALLESGLPRDIIVARIDGYLRAEDESLMALENNADSPAGQLFTARVNGLVEALSGPYLRARGVSFQKLPIDTEHALLDVLVRLWRCWKGSTRVPRIAILQEQGRANVESQEMARMFTGRGVPVVVRDPQAVRFDETGARDEQGEIDLVWNKINTVYWRDFIRRNAGEAERWHEAIARRRLLHVNPFSARFVAESKRSLALLRDERFRSLFELDDWNFLSELLPWAAKLEPGRAVEWQGTTVELHKLLLSQQHAFVLKEPYDIRGDGVTIGRSTPREAWLEKVDRGFAEGFIAQAFIEPLQVPCLLGESGRVQSMKVSLDSFMLDGAFAGFGSKASRNDRVNLFQGGRKLAVRVVAEVR